MLRGATGRADVPIKKENVASWAATKPQLNFLLWLYFLRSKYEKWGWVDFVSDK